jgi:hypothetical protein
MPFRDPCCFPGLAHGCLRFSLGGTGPPVSPGVYAVTGAIHVVRPNTIIMGLGLATVTPTTGSAAIKVDDVPGVSISAITVDANTMNTGAHGLVVTGDHVTALGLFVEHYQQTQVLWNGDAGRTIFLQSEAPYDPPNQAAYMNGSEDGYPYYEIGEHVRSHEASGMSVATLFIYSPTPIYIHSAYKAPFKPNIHLRHILGEVLLGQGGIQNLVNDDGISAVAGGESFPLNVGGTTQLTAYP